MRRPSRARKDGLELESLRRVGAYRPGIRPTHEGVRLLLLLAVMGFASFNTKNNLLYLMFSIGLATVGISLLAGWTSLRGLVIDLGGVSDLYAGVVCPERFRMRNLSRWLDAYAVKVEELDFPGGSAHTILGRIGRADAVDFQLEKSYPHRGVFETERLRLSTSFPFGLFSVRRLLSLHRRLIVYPPVLRTDISFVFRNRNGATPHRRRRGESDELLRIREYTVGDNLHHLHWKATAKANRLMVREFANEEQRRFFILFDNRETGSEESARSAERFESMVTAAASLASHLASHRLAFRFVSAEVSFSPSFSPEHLRGILTYLATVEVCRTPAQDLEHWARVAFRSDEIVLLLASRGSALLNSDDSPYLHHIEPERTLMESVASGDRLQGMDMVAG